MELYNLNKIYDFKHPYLQCFGVDKQFANSILVNLSQFANQNTINGPDLYSKDNQNIITGIEHFEYDASRKSRRGSGERSEIERADREFLKEAREAASKGLNYSESYTTKGNANNTTLKSNFLCSFKKHANKINAYEKNLKEHFHEDNVPIWFLAEDKNIMGPTISGVLAEGCPMLPALPVFYKEVYSEMLSSPIKGIIFISNYPVSNYIVFIKNTNTSLRSMAQYYHLNESISVSFPNNLPYDFRSFCV